MSASPYGLARCEELLNSAVEASHLAGAQLYVSINGEPVVDTAVGQARGGVPMSTSTLVRWACAAKPVMGLAMAQLVEKAVLRLEDTVASIVPAFAAHGKDLYTIEDLLTHNIPYDEPALHQRLADMVFDVLAADATLDAEHVLSSVCSARLVPANVRLGNGGGYSLAANFFLVAEIIRRVCGREPQEYLRTEVFEVLGMSDTWATLDADVLACYSTDDIGITHIARPHRRRRKLQPLAAVDALSITALCAPGSSVWGPARDLGRFYEEMLEALAGRSALLSKVSATDVVTPRRPPGWESVYGAFQAWGLGAQTMMWPLYGTSVSFDAFGHDGFASTFGLADPTIGLVTAFASNTMMDEHFQLWRSLTDAIYAEVGAGGSPFHRAAWSGREVPAFARPDGSLVGICPCGSCTVTTDVLLPELPCVRRVSSP